MHIDREDMLELTRRMTLSRSCFGRVAGAYMDEEGFIDGTFNTHFQKLSGADRTKNLKLSVFPQKHFRKALNRINTCRKSVRHTPFSLPRVPGYLSVSCRILPFPALCKSTLYRHCGSRKVRSHIPSALHD